MKRERMGRTTCAPTGKKRYRGYWEARAAAGEIRHQTGDDHGKPYRCDECGGWHLGRSSFQIR